MNYSEGVTRINNTLDTISGLVSSKREFIIKQTVNSVLLFIILIVFGCMDFATLKFHGEYLLTASFWGTIGTKMIAAVLAFNVGINMMLDNEIKKSEELSRNIEVYNELIALKDTDFEFFVIKVFNVKLKIKAYKNLINRKIYWLNKFASRKSKLLYSQEPRKDLDEDLYKLEQNFIENRKEKNRYCIKRKELEELRSDEYINKNIDALSVRFKEVDPAVFELEINGAPKSSGVKVSGNITYGRIKESSSIVLSMLSISMLTTSFALSASKEVFESQLLAFWHYCLKVVEDIAVVLWQFFNGTLRARKIVSTQLTEPYAGRNEVLREYINWRHETQAKESHVFEILKKEENEEVLEVTEEQYKQMLGN